MKIAQCEVQTICGECNGSGKADGATGEHCQQESGERYMPTDESPQCATCNGWGVKLRPLPIADTFEVKLKMTSGEKVDLPKLIGVQMDALLGKAREFEKSYQKSIETQLEKSREEGKHFPTFEE